MHYTHRYKQAFYQHKADASNRRIEWLLTFDDWLKVWQDSGLLDQRGSRKGQYCVARFGDTGPYAVWNVKIILHSDNVSEGQKGKAKSEETKQKMRKPKSAQHRAKLAEINRKRSKQKTVA